MVRRIGARGRTAPRIADMQLARSLLFTAFLFVWTGLLAIGFVIVAPLMSFPSRWIIVRFWAHSMLAALRVTCGLRYQVEGRENLPRGNHIALWKHSSSWETMAINLVFPRQVWVLKRELQWVPVLGWALMLLHAIAIDRGAGRTAVTQVLEQGKQRLAEGDWITVFPEGTRTPPGERRKFGVSGALLASETGRLIVPVAHNAGYFWPRRGLLKRPGTVRVIIGPPILAAGRDARDINDEAQRWIETQMQTFARERGVIAEPQVGSQAAQ
jgi:1-acyl-sn-glycerol-3-phosphate acyltransferase